MLNNRTVDTRKLAIEHVVNSFAGMGATPEQLHQERLKLEQDDNYLGSWLSVTGGDFILDNHYKVQKANAFLSWVLSLKKWVIF